MPNSGCLLAHMRVLALDPGQRVGWASADVFPQEGPMIPRLIVRDHGIMSLRDAALAVYKAIVVEQRYDHVVYESWRLTAKGARVLQGDDMQSSQFIGMVRLCCWLSGTPITAQAPAVMASARRSLHMGGPSADDIRERIAKLPRSHDESHDGSALLHLWHWFFERYV